MSAVVGTWVCGGGEWETHAIGEQQKIIVRTNKVFLSSASHASCEAHAPLLRVSHLDPKAVLRRLWSSRHHKRLVRRRVACTSFGLYCVYVCSVASVHLKNGETLSFCDILCSLDHALILAWWLNRILWSRFLWTRHESLPSHRDTALLG